MARTHKNVPMVAGEYRECLGHRGSSQLVTEVIRELSGRWKLAIIFRLFEVPILRFSDLMRDIDRISHKVLTQQLRELEADGYVARTDHGIQPLRVDYGLTPKGRALMGPLTAIRDFGLDHRSQHPEHR